MSRHRPQAPPTLEVWWDEPMEEAADGSFSTTVRVALPGNWGGNAPDEATLAFGERSQAAPTEHEVVLQGRPRAGEQPLTGFAAGHHYLLRVTAGGMSVQKLIAVPKKKLESENQKATASNRQNAEYYRSVADRMAAELEANPDVAALQRRAKIHELRGSLPKPVAVTVSAGRHGNNKYTLVIVISDEHGKGIPHHTGTMRDGEKVKPFATDEHGTFVYTTEAFADARPRWIEVSAGVGTNLNWGQKLYKPS